MPNSEPELHKAIGRVMGVIVNHHTMATNTSLGEQQTNAVHNARAKIIQEAQVGGSDTVYDDAFGVWVKSLNNLLTMVPMVPRQPVPQMMKTAKSDSANLAKYMKKRKSIQGKAVGAGKLKVHFLRKKMKNLNNRYQMDSAKVQTETHRTERARGAASADYRQSNMTHIEGLPAYKSWQRSNRLVHSLLEGQHKTSFDTDVTSIEFFLADSLITY